METLRVFRVELYRLLRSRAAIVSGALLVLVPAVWVTLRYGLQQAGLGGARPDDVYTGVGWGEFVDAWRVGMVLGTVLLVIHGARSLAADRESWVLRLGVTRRTSRVALVLGRALLSPVLVALVVVLSGVGAWFTAGLFFDFGDVGQDGYVMFTVQEVRAELIGAILLTLGPMIATYLFALLVSAVSASAVLAVSAALSLFLAYDLFKEVLGRVRYFFFATYIPSLQDSSAVAEASKLAHGLSDAGFPERIARMNLVMPWPAAAALLGLCLVVVSRRSL